MLDRADLVLQQQTSHRKEKVENQTIKKEGEKAEVWVRNRKTDQRREGKIIIEKLCHYTWEEGKQERTVNFQAGLQGFPPAKGSSV